MSTIDVTFERQERIYNEEKQHFFIIVCNVFINTNVFIKVTSLEVTLEICN